MMEPVGVMN